MPRGAIVVMGMVVVMGSSGGEGKGWWASGGDAEGRDSGRAEAMSRGAVEDERKRCQG